MRTTIVLDAMGSDERPKPELAAAVLSTQTDDIDLILVGDEQTLSSGLAAQPGDKSHIRIVHAPEAIDMTDHIQEARAKKQNTMQVGMDLVRKGEAQAFVTAGNTGMAMYFGTKIFGLMPGVIRPCLSTTFPVKGGKAVILDVGANAECRPEFLVQFGQMGQVYARIMLNRTNPTVGLLSNGEEEGKGNDLVREAGPLMRQQVPGFIGNIEGKEFFGGKVDVAVTDGFTGNVLMKSSEALGKLLFETLKEELMRSTRTKLGALLAKPAFDSVRKLIDPSEVGAAPLLGLDGLVFVGHGRSDAKAMVSAINQARIAIELNLLESLRKAITFTNTKESDS
ncbi:MAG TPA: phosphate acyltransferase PlsX [Anaerolineaceae bacterium]|nr:phosphate acyltransferase PlsX [Anaerolineaceae bacterium]HOF24654.1 phosphate acyltransferase PlsX [Anaerolineaceae bacterium]HOR77332.1 phosphate acyltransferase PlsX [Anaerolineaceae bacterium]HQM65379.1 phosphate acyltransferase PlsX [Anaerolineaceae bacterium]